MVSADGSPCVLVVQNPPADRIDGSARANCLGRVTTPVHLERLGDFDDGGVGAVVDDKPHRPRLAVFEHEHHGPTKVRILELRNGAQKMPSQARGRTRLRCTHRDQDTPDQARRHVMFGGLAVAETMGLNAKKCGLPVELSGANARPAAKRVVARSVP